MIAQRLCNLKKWWLLQRHTIYRPAAKIDDDELFLPAGQLGMGWWGDAWDEVKSVAKKVQANPIVRGLEKKAVDYGMEKTVPSWLKLLAVGTLCRKKAASSPN